MVFPVIFSKRRNNNAGVWAVTYSRNELFIPDIKSNMRNCNSIRRLKENQISRFKLFIRNNRTNLINCSNFFVYATSFSRLVFSFAIAAESAKHLQGIKRSSNPTALTAYSFILFLSLNIPSIIESIYNFYKTLFHIVQNLSM